MADEKSEYSWSANLQVLREVRGPYCRFQNDLADRLRQALPDTPDRHLLLEVVPLVWDVF